MERPDIRYANGYEIIQGDNGWVVFNDEGIVSGPHVTLAEAEEAANRLEKER